LGNVFANILEGCCCPFFLAKLEEQKTNRAKPRIEIVLTCWPKFVEIKIND
jgi:hypothetical protein